MKKALTAVLAVLAFAAAATAAPLDSFKGLSGKMDIAGGTAHIPVMKEAAKRIMTVNPKISITVAGGGSGVGVKQVGEGLVHIGNTGRALKDAEVQQYGLKTFPFAVDGVALVINPANKIDDLTSQQVAAIYAGTITDWSEVGGDAGKINVFGREDGSGTRDTFTDKVLHKGALAPDVNVVNSNGAMKTTVAGDVRAMGYVGIGHIDETVKAPRLDGMTANQQNAADGSYTVVRQLYMNTKGEPEGLTKAFIDYIYSEEGAEIIKKSGYIPLPRK